MGFMSPKAPPPPKPTPPAPRVDQNEIKAKEEASQIRSRFGQEDTMLTLGRTRQRTQMATMLGRSGQGATTAGGGSMGY